MEKLFRFVGDTTTITSFDSNLCLRRKTFACFRGGGAARGEVESGFGVPFPRKTSDLSWEDSVGGN